MVSESRSLAAGIINQLKGSGWIDLAEELASLDDDEFRRLMSALQLYREAIKEEKKEVKKKVFPKRKPFSP